MANDEPLLVDSALLEQAKQLCKRRLDKDPENRTILRSLGEIHRKQGHLAEAAGIYNRLSQLDPQDREAGYLAAGLSGKEWLAPPPGFRAAPFVLLRDFLPKDFHDTLIPYLVSIRERFISAPVDSPTGEGQYAGAIRDTLHFKHQWEGKQRIRSYLAKVLPGAIQRLQIPSFQSVGIELNVRAYQDGHFIKVHQDGGKVRLVAPRVVSFVYFFHKVPRPYTGGELVLFDTDPEANEFMRARYTLVTPEDNSLIVFASSFFHSVVPVRCPSKDFADSRFAINGFVHKRLEEDDGPAPDLQEATASGRD